MDERDLDLHELAQRIADGETIPYALAHQANDDVETLLRLARVVEAFRELRERDGQDKTQRPQPLFRWGALEVENEVARGRYGVVYRAHDPALGRTVALKLAPPELSRGSDGRRFLDESRRLARLRHAHVVAVYGAARHDDTPGFWTEWIEGDTLEGFVALNGPLAAAEAWAVLRDLAAALDFVHARGIVHGDVKPANVLRERGGRIVLTDFGAGGDKEELATRITLTGTPAYLAPELIAGATPDVGSDRYALAGVAVFLLTGMTPSAGLGALRARATLPAEALHAVLRRALADDPAERYPTAAAIVDALGEYLEAPPPARPVAARRRSGMRIALVAGLLAAASIVSVTWWPGSGSAPRVNFERQLGDVAQPLNDGGSIDLGDRLALQVSHQQPLWVYVLNEDQAGVATLLYPLPGLDRGNPLPPGPQRLPGTRAGVMQYWQVSSDGGRESFLVLLASQPLPQVEAMLVAGTASIAQPQSRRAVQQVAVADSRGLPIEGEQLRALVQSLSQAPVEGRELYVHRFVFD